MKVTLRVDGEQLHFLCARDGHVVTVTGDDDGLAAVIRRRLESIDGRLSPDDAMRHIDLALERDETDGFVESVEGSLAGSGFERVDVEGANDGNA